MRFKEMDTLIHQQNVHFQEQSKRIQNLEGVVSVQTNEIHKLRGKIEALENDSVNQKSHIKNLKIAIDALKKKQTESDNFLSNLMTTTLREPSSGLNMTTNLPNEEGTEDQRRTHPQEVVTSRSKERRLLIGVTDVPPVVKPTAFYAYLSHHELTMTKDHTIKFDTVKTNHNSAYSEFTGVFTVPIEGVYGFTYTIRMGCNSADTAGPFEIVKNNEVEGVVYIYDHTCQSQDTVTGIAIIHATIGDKIYIRSHSTYSIDGHVYSDKNGRTSFAGWLIQKI